MTLSATPAGGFAGQHQLEMSLRQLVLALEEKGAGEFQPHADQPGLRDQHGVEGGDGLVQQRVARVFGLARLVRRPDCCDADVEKHGGIDRPIPHQRPEETQRIVETADPDQNPGILDFVRSARTRCRLRRGLLPGAQCRA